MVRVKNVRKCSRAFAVNAKCSKTEQSGSKNPSLHQGPIANDWSLLAQCAYYDSVIHIYSYTCVWFLDIIYCISGEAGACTLPTCSYSKRPDAHSVFFYCLSEIARTSTGWSSIEYKRLNRSKISRSSTGWSSIEYAWSSSRRSRYFGSIKSFVLLRSMRY